MVALVVWDHVVSVRFRDSLPFSGCGCCNRSIAPCDGVGFGASPKLHPKFVAESPSLV